MTAAVVKVFSVRRVHEVSAQAAVIIVQRFQRHYILVEARSGIVGFAEHNKEQTSEKVLRTLLPRAVDLTGERDHLRGELADERGNFRFLHIADNGDVAVERFARGKRFAVVLDIKIGKLVIFAVADKVLARLAFVHCGVTARVADLDLLAVEFAQRIPSVGQREVLEIENVCFVAVLFKVRGVVAEKFALGVGDKEVGLVFLR